MRRLEQRATSKLDYGGASIRTRSEPEFLQQGDHPSAGRDGTRCPRRVGNRTLAQTDTGVLHQVATPRSPCLDGIDARMPTRAGNVRGQRGRKTGIVARTLVGSEVGCGAVEPRGAPSSMRCCPSANNQPVVGQAVQMFADGVGMLTKQSRQRSDRARLRLVDQNVEDGRPGGREAGSTPVHLCRRRGSIPRSWAGVRCRSNFSLHISTDFIVITSGLRRQSHRVEGPRAAKRRHLGDTSSPRPTTTASTHGRSGSSTPRGHARGSRC